MYYVIYIYIYYIIYYINIFFASDDQKRCQAATSRCFHEAYSSSSALAVHRNAAHESNGKIMASGAFR